MSDPIRVSDIARGRPEEAQATRESEETLCGERVSQETSVEAVRGFEDLLEGVGSGPWNSVGVHKGFTTDLPRPYNMHRFDITLVVCVKPGKEDEAARRVTGWVSDEIGREHAKILRHREERARNEGPAPRGGR